MVNKNLLILTLLLVAGAAVVLLTDGETSREKDPRLHAEVVDLNRLPGVDRIEIDAGSEPLVLVKANSQWRIGTPNGFPVDPTRVVRLFDDIGQVEFGRLVTDKQDRLAELGLDKPKTLRLRQGDEQVLALKLGDNRTKGGQYMSLGDETKGYLASRAMHLSADESSWERKQLLNVPKEDVQRIAFNTHGRKAVSLSRKDAEADLQLDGAGDVKLSSQVKGQTSILSNLSFTKRVDLSNAEAQAAFAGPDVDRVAVTLFDGRTVAVEIGSVGEGDKGKKTYIKLKTALKAGVAADDKYRDFLYVNDLMQMAVFEVSSYVGDKFRKGRSDFVDSSTAQSKSNAGKG